MQNQFQLQIHTQTKPHIRTLNALPHASPKSSSSGFHHPKNPTLWASLSLQKSQNKSGYLTKTQKKKGFPDFNRWFGIKKEKQFEDPLLTTSDLENLQRCLMFQCEFGQNKVNGLSNLPEMAVANPQPPPHTSFHESPASEGSERGTGTGDSIGDFSSEAPGRYPHMYTIFSAHSSSSTTTFASSAASFSPMARKLRSGKRQDEGPKRRRNPPELF